MLFNSYSFIFVFLPIVFGGFFTIGRRSHWMAMAWLASASLFFYAWWDIRFLGILLGSVIFNYGAGCLIASTGKNHGPARSKTVLTLAVTLNLAALAYFKYANFFISTVLPEGQGHSVVEIALPLGISFFTFTQIAFLVDTHRGKVREFQFVRYLLFVTYFPHLIAGPILHHQEMMPQFAQKAISRINWQNVSIGMSIFVLGLAKKVFIADALADVATPVFSAVATGAQPMLFEAWLGALAYTFQLYFDFSAYSDMAIGLSLMFNVKLPLNFNSPYKATSIIDFWRRWHMTLSSFLRSYLYFPLGGNRCGKTRRYGNLLATMILGGLWHGAGWTFIVWGALHGLYLVVNHGWQHFKHQAGIRNGGKVATLAGGALTFLAVVVGWVFFRADTLPSAFAVLHGMAGLNGVSLPASAEKLVRIYLGGDWVTYSGFSPLTGPSLRKAVLFLGLAAWISWFMPNVRQIFRDHQIVCDALGQTPQSPPTPGARKRALAVLRWRPTPPTAWALGVLFACAAMELTRVSEFLYFQF